MKIFIIAVLLMIGTFQLSAQDILFNTREKETLNLFYIDLIAKVATLNGSWGLFGGIRAGYNVNANISIGLLANGLIPEKLGGSYINKDGKDELHLGYGGLEATFKHNFSKKFYLSAIMMIGAGRADYENLGGDDYFFVLEPGTSFGYRLTSWFGLGYSVSYRFAAGVKYANFTDASFSGWATSFDVKFGFYSFNH